MIWFATFVVWPSPLPPDERDVLAHQLEERLDPRERRLGAADHDRERRRLGADFAARNRARRGSRSRARRSSSRTPSSRAARSSSCRRRSCPCASPCATPSVAEQHGLDVRRVGHHREDDRPPSARPPSPFAQRMPPASIERLRDAGAARADDRRCPPLIRCPAIGAPMMPSPMNPMFAMFASPSAHTPCAARQPRPSSVVPFGLYSQPIQPS